MPIILNLLKKPLDDIAVFVQFGIKVMLNPEIGFIGDTSNSPVLLKVTTNLLVTVSIIRENCFTLEFYAFEKSDSRFRVVNLPAGQDYVQKLHSVLDKDVDFGVFAATRCSLSKLNRHSDAPYKKWNPSQAR